LPALQGLVVIGFENYRQQKRLSYSTTGLSRKADEACVMGILNRFYRTLHFSFVSCFALRSRKNLPLQSSGFDKFVYSASGITDKIRFEFNVSVVAIN
jgi:hypothetical protein